MSFVCFLGEVTAWQFCFEIDWPLCSSIKLFCHRHSSIDFLQILFWAATPQIIYKHAMLLQISRRISIKLLLNLWAHDFAKSTTAQRLNLLVFRPVDWLPISTYCSEFRFVKLANIASVHCSVLQSYTLHIWDLCMTATYKVSRFIFKRFWGPRSENSAAIRRMVYHMLSILSAINSSV